MGRLAALLFLFVGVALTAEQKVTDEDAKTYLEKLSVDYGNAMNLMMEKRWAYITNVKPETEQEMIKANTAFQQFQKTTFDSINTNFNDDVIVDLDDDLKRQFKFYKIIGNGALQEQDQSQINEILAGMESTYGTAKVCPYTGTLDPEPNCAKTWTLDDLSIRMTESTDYAELTYIWQQWRVESGKPIIDDYEKFVELSNKAAVEQGFSDTGKLWNEYYLYSGYTEQNFKDEISALWEQVKPLYKQLYTYVRRVMNDKLYDDQMNIFAPMPAHIFGNMWAQSWINIADHVTFFNNVTSADATPGMVEQGKSVKWMFETSEEFFTKLGFRNMTDIFWEKSMLERPVDKEVQCHASAEDFYLTNDFRIKMCTQITQEDLTTVHHEMGHIAYFMEYESQPYIYRNGANPGFHEAIGDCLALAVSTPSHLRGLGLIENEKPVDSPVPRFRNLPALPEGTSHEDMNYLLRMALDKITFLPFSIAMDQWRWDIFSGKTKKEDYNKAWWELVLKYQGLVPPVTPAVGDFDPGAKYHIPANVEYIRYFVSFIVQFQFYEGMCEASGHTGPLHLCDFDENTEAGAKLMNMMKKGMSSPWNEALAEMTVGGVNKMDASSMLNYFEPLLTYLTEINEPKNAPKKELCIGWECNYEEEAQKYMSGTFETDMNDKCYNAAISEWNYQTDIKPENEQKLIEESLKFSAYEKEAWDNYITEFDYANFKDENLKRQFQLQSVLGVAALEETKLEKLNQVQTTMQNIYSSGLICPFSKQDCDLTTEGIPLEGEPGKESIEDILEQSDNYEELTHVWKAWRDATGKKMLTNYTTYVELSNEAAKANYLDNYGDLWIMQYDMGNDFKVLLEKILNETKPFYDRIHAFTRKRLLEKYPGKFGEKDPIPASLLGNMWAQSWEGIYPLLAPFPNLPALDVSSVMVEKNWTVQQIFTTSEKFFTDLGLKAMPTTYGNNSMIVKPNDRVVTCHASAWDFCKEEDYRIKMCTGVNMQDLITVHHELGHIQYYQQYRGDAQPYTFRDGANPGFHEAIGDVLALSVQTPKHLKKIQLLDDTYIENADSDLNFLMLTALSKIVFLPFAYVMDRWRWDIFAGEVPPEQWNRHWWDLRAEFQGLMPPTTRTNSDLDAGSKYHIPANVEYSRYFVAHILQFQLHKKLCEEAGQFVPNDANKPLYRCDIDGSTSAGEILRKVLVAGSSEPWTKILNDAIGTEELSAQAILDFFKPLSDWLDKQITAEELGWDSSRIEDLFTEEGGSLGSDDTVAIAVGVTLGVLVIIVVVGYFVGTSRQKKKAKKEAAKVDAETPAALGQSNEAFNAS